MRETGYTLSPNTDANHHDALPIRFSTRSLLLKLVLLPALLVLAVVTAALMIGWLTLPGDDVQSLLDELAREGDARWQAAVNLAAVLHEPGGAALKSDSQIARRLIEILQEEIRAARMDPDHVKLRMYLCRALGEFHLSDPLPVLLEAARLQRHQREADVRRSAIEAIAVLASHADLADSRPEAQLLPVLLQAATDRQMPLRCAAAFTLGVVGGARAVACLETMLADEYPEVRYNAATGLARHGNLRCIEILVEMLDPNQSEITRSFPREMIQLNALRAVAKLAEANPQADLAELLQAVERLTRAGVAAEVRLKAAELLHQ